jgi:TRAP-type C4-dicarboxylate transport system substrate-binding protein
MAMLELLKHRYTIGIGVTLAVGLLMIGFLPASSLAQAKPFVLRYSSGLPHTSHVSTVQKFWGEQVEKRTGGKVTVQIYVGGQLYKHATVLDAVSNGAIEMGLAPLSMWGGYNPVFLFGTTFFMCNSMDQWSKARDNLDKVLDPLAQKFGVKFLHYIGYSYNGIASRVPIKKFTDVKGLKIRGGGLGTVESLKAAGAIAVQLDEAEVYDAISMGAIDGASSGFDSFYGRKYSEVCKFFVGHVSWVPYVTFINLNVWSNLPKDIQKIILEVSGAAEALSYDLSEKRYAEAEGFLKSKATVWIWTSEEVSEGRKLLQAYYASWLKKCADAGYGIQAKKVYDILMETR